MKPHTKALKEMKEMGKLKIPCEIFNNRKLGPLECLVEYLCVWKGYSISGVAHFLNRDPRTIFTVKNRAIKKMGDTQ